MKKRYIQPQVVRHDLVAETMMAASEPGISDKYATEDALTKGNRGWDDNDWSDDDSWTVGKH